jgi:ABC-type sugar transport system substrate-binding protein
MNKRILFATLTVVLAIGMVTTVFAAGNQQSGSGKPIIGYISKNTIDSFHFPTHTTGRRIMTELKEKGTIADWHFYDGLTDPVTQIALIDTAISQGCTHIIFFPAEATGSSPVLDKAKEKGIPIIVVNSRTNNTDQLATAYVGSDDVQAGEMMAQFIQRQFPNGGSYGHIMGPIGNSAQVERTQGVRNILDKDSKWKLLDEQSGNWQSDQAARFAEDWNNKYRTQMNAIICDNDDMSSAAQYVLNSAGRRDVVCIGVDGNPGPLNMIKQGDLVATIRQNGVGQITRALELLVDLIEGKQIPKKTMIDFEFITKDNVDQYLK